MTTEAIPYWRKPVPPIHPPGATAVIAAVEPPDAPAIVNDELPPVSAPVANGSEAAPDKVSAPLPETRLAPHEILRNAVEALDLARWEARQARTAVSEARTAFAQCLNAWNASGAGPQDRDGLMKEWIESNQRERARRAEMGQLRRPMTVGETARAYGGGGHNVQRGHGRAYARGALSKAQALEVNANRLRAAAAARKLPNER